MLISCRAIAKLLCACCDGPTIVWEIKCQIYFKCDIIQLTVFPLVLHAQKMIFFPLIPKINIENLYLRGRDSIFLL
jgi:hypothetical protein